MTWNKMREVTKPERGFVYSCENGHEWFLALTEWDNRGSNLCHECGVAAEEAASDGLPA